MRGKWIGIVAALALIVGLNHFWHKSPERKSAKTAVVQEKSQEDTLMVHGMVVPISAQYLLAPMDSTVVRFWHAFGDAVKQGDRLVELHDEKVYQNFSEAVVAYLKNKDRLALTDKKLQGEKELLEEGVIALHEYMKHQSEQQNAYVDWLQSRIKLERLAKWVNVSMKELDDLKLANQEAVEKELRRSLAIYLTADADGHFYAPLPKAGNRKDDKQVALAEGARIKQGQSLGLVAKGEEVEVRFWVSENDIHVVKPGLSVRVYPENHSDQPWDMVIETANVHQASAHASGEPASLVVIAKGRSAPKEWVHIGGVVKGRVALGKKVYHMVPLSAVFEKDEQYWVSVKRTGKWEDVSVDTHVLSADSVGLLGDVAVGEEVMLHD